MSKDNWEDPEHQDQHHDATGDQDIDPWASDDTSSLTSDDDSLSSLHDPDPETDPDEDQDAVDENEGDDAEQAASTNAADKKKSKLKTYAMLGGIGVALASAVGGTMMYKQSKKNAMNYEPPAAITQMQVENDVAPIQKPAPLQSAPNGSKLPPATFDPKTGNPTQQPQIPSQVPQQTPQVQAPASLPVGQNNPSAQAAQPAQPVTQPVAQTTQQPDQQTASAVNTAPEQVQQSVRGPQSTGEVTAGSIEDLSAKADKLAVYFVQLRDQTNNRMGAYEKAIGELGKGLGQQGAKIAELEEAISEMRETVRKLSEKAGLNKAKAEPKKEQKSEAKQEAKAAKQSEKSAEIKSEKPAEQKPAAEQKPRAGGLGGYRVVATYPSTTQSAMPAQKAWITNGEKLIEVVVGSTINGAKITGFEGTKVITTAGVIYPAK